MENFPLNHYFVYDSLFFSVKSVMCPSEDVSGTAKNLPCKYRWNIGFQQDWRRASYVGGNPNLVPYSIVIAVFLGSLFAYCTCIKHLLFTHMCTKWLLYLGKKKDFFFLICSLSSSSIIYF